VGKQEGIADSVERPPWGGYSDRSGGGLVSELLFDARPYGDRVLKFDLNLDAVANLPLYDFHLVANLG